jgi:hypothetical protein
MACSGPGLSLAHAARYVACPGEFFCVAVPTCRRERRSGLDLRPVPAGSRGSAEHREADRSRAVCHRHRAVGHEPNCHYASSRLLEVPDGRHRDRLATGLRALSPHSAGGHDGNRGRLWPEQRASGLYGSSHPLLDGCPRDTSSFHQRGLLGCGGCGAVHGCVRTAPDGRRGPHRLEQPLQPDHRDARKLQLRFRVHGGRHASGHGGRPAPPPWRSRCSRTPSRDRSPPLRVWASSPWASS